MSISTSLQAAVAKTQCKELLTFAVLWQRRQVEVKWCVPEPAERAQFTQYQAAKPTLAKLEDFGVQCRL